MNTAPTPRRLLTWLASLVLSALVLLTVAPGALAQDRAVAAPELEASAGPVIDPPARVARLGYIEGDVSMMTAGSDEWTQAVLNRPFTSGDRLWVDGAGRAELQMGSSQVYLDHQTSLGLIELDDDVIQMSLTEGAATIRVQRLAQSETIQIETLNATVFLRRPGEYHLTIDTAGDRSIVKTRNGEAQVVGGGRSYTVDANQMGTFSGLDELSSSFATLPPRNEFEAWANERDQRAEHAVSSRYVSRDVIGYEDLDDQGEWVSEPEYGHVWRPRYVASDWAPYRYGQWSWISPWGWTWVDDARWGFAPFHYGRWAHVRNRWCWVPGPRHLRPVYAPALVGWIGGPSLSVSIGLGSGVGWFPLAPHEVYRPWYRHTPRHIRRVNDTNTIILDRRRMTDLYPSRQPHAYRHGHQPGAVTFVQRDRFSGHPVASHRLTVDRHELRQWREGGRAPVFTPGQDRLAAGHPARRPPSIRPGDGPRDARGDRHSVRQGDLLTDRLRDRQSSRFGTPVDSERGGDAPGANRSLPSVHGFSSRRPAKERGDFHVTRTRVPASTAAERAAHRRTSDRGFSSPPTLVPREQRRSDVRSGLAAEGRPAADRELGTDRRFDRPPAGATRMSTDGPAGRSLGSARPSGNTLTTRPQNGRVQPERLDTLPAQQTNRTSRPSPRAGGESWQGRYSTTGPSTGRAGTATTTRPMPPARNVDAPHGSRSVTPPHRTAPPQRGQDTPSQRSAPRQRQRMDNGMVHAPSGNASPRHSPRSTPQVSRPKAASPSRSSPRRQKD